MRVPARIYAASAMPDVQSGYGFPVDGVAAFDYDTGIISAGGIGFDINCGVRLLRYSLLKTDVAKHISRIGQTIFAGVPSGVGKRGKLILKGKHLDSVLCSAQQKKVARLKPIAVITG
jgi:tRNA-splicing ligase RtcB